MKLDFDEVVDIAGEIGIRSVPPRVRIVVASIDQPRGRR